MYDINEINRWVFQKFHMKDTKKAKFILGIHIGCDPDRGRSIIRPLKYVENFLREYGMENTHSVVIRN